MDSSSGQSIGNQKKEIGTSCIPHPVDGNPKGILLKKQHLYYGKKNRKKESGI